jgi:hypothetical protein
MHRNESSAQFLNQMALGDDLGEFTGTALVQTTQRHEKRSFGRRPALRLADGTQAKGWCEAYCSDDYR